MRQEVDERLHLVGMFPDRKGQRTSFQPIAMTKVEVRERVLALAAERAAAESRDKEPARVTQEIDESEL